MTTSPFSAFVPEPPPQTRTTNTISRETLRLYARICSYYLEVIRPDERYVAVSIEWLASTALPAFHAFLQDQHQRPFNDIYATDTYDCNSIAIAFYSFLRTCQRLYWKTLPGAALAVGWGYTGQRPLDLLTPTNHALMLALGTYNGEFTLWTIEPQHAGHTAILCPMHGTSFYFAHF